jgi:hypothetical protein
MIDQVLNYSEPPFCRPHADADMLLIQFALICHTSRVAGRLSLARDDDGMKESIQRVAFAGQGTARLVNLLLHRFGVFDFLGFETAPTVNVEKYKTEIGLGLYPPEIKRADDVTVDVSTPELILPWTYCPAPDPATCLALVQELLHLIILLITVSNNS